jgi:hypothetical protein
MDHERAERLAELRARRRGRERPGIVATVASTLGVGLIVGWISIFLVGFVEGGEWPDRVSNLPFAFFALGCVWGFALTRVTDVREATLYLIAPLVLGAFVWMVGLAAGSLLVAFGASERVADSAPTAGFAVGAVLGCVPLAARLAAAASGVRTRFSRR